MVGYRKYLGRQGLGDKKLGKAEVCKNVKHCFKILAKIFHLTDFSSMKS